MQFLHNIMLYNSGFAIKLHFLFEKQKNINLQKQHTVMFNYRKLRQLRKAKNLTQEELSDILCISQSSYARLENGTSKNGFFYIEKLCEVFNITPFELLHISIPDTAIENELLKNSLNEKEKVIAFLESRVHKLENTLLLFNKLSRKV